MPRDCSQLVQLPDVPAQEDKYHNFPSYGLHRHQTSDDDFKLKYKQPEHVKFTKRSISSTATSFYDSLEFTIAIHHDSEIVSLGMKTQNLLL